jgi:hypothetical protein
MRKWFVALAASAGLVGLGATGAVASATPHQASVSVAGAVATPATYSLSALEALPQTTFTVTRRTWRGSVTQTDEGVSLETIVNDSGPILPSDKNASLRVVITVAGGRRQERTFALGELDPGFGNHPAYLTLDAGGHPLREPTLIVPGDRNGARTVPDVGEIEVGVENPDTTTPPDGGALTVQDGGYSTVLSPAELASLPQKTLTVTFESESGEQTHTETGPTLDEVLLAARIRPTFNTWVAAVGSDDYVATATPAEAWVGRRPLLISLVEDGVPLPMPRLITDGDVMGGRYVDMMTNLVVGGSLLAPPWGW